MPGRLRVDITSIIPCQSAMASRIIGCCRLTHNRLISNENKDRCYTYIYIYIYSKSYRRSPIWWLTFTITCRSQTAVVDHRSCRLTKTHCLNVGLRMRQSRLFGDAKAYKCSSANRSPCFIGWPSSPTERFIEDRPLYHST